MARGVRSSAGLVAPEHNAAAMLLLYGANLPWLAGNAWIAWEGGRGLVAAMGTRRHEGREGMA